MANNGAGTDDETWEDASDVYEIRSEAATQSLKDRKSTTRMMLNRVCWETSRIPGPNVKEGQSEDRQTQSWNEERYAARPSIFEDRRCKPLLPTIKWRCSCNREVAEIPEGIDLRRFQNVSIHSRQSNHLPKDIYQTAPIWRERELSGVALGSVRNNSETQPVERFRKSGLFKVFAIWWSKSHAWFGERLTSASPDATQSKTVDAARNPGSGTVETHSSGRVYATCREGKVRRQSRPEVLIGGGTERPGWTCHTRGFVVCGAADGRSGVDTGRSWESSCRGRFWHRGRVLGTGRCSFRVSRQSCDRTRSIQAAL